MAPLREDLGSLYHIVYGWLSLYMSWFRSAKLSKRDYTCKMYRDEAIALGLWLYDGQYLYYHRSKVCAGDDLSSQRTLICPLPITRRQEITAPKQSAGNPACGMNCTKLLNPNITRVQSPPTHLAEQFHAAFRRNLCGETPVFPKIHQNFKARLQKSLSTSSGCTREYSKPTIRFSSS